MDQKTKTYFSESVLPYITKESIEEPVQIVDDNKYLENMVKDLEVDLVNKGNKIENLEDKNRYYELEIDSLKKAIESKDKILNMYIDNYNKQNEENIIQQTKLVNEINRLSALLLAQKQPAQVPKPQYDNSCSKKKQFPPTKSTQQPQYDYYCSPFQTQKAQYDDLVKPVSDCCSVASQTQRYPSRPQYEDLAKQVSDYCSMPFQARKQPETQRQPAKPQYDDLAKPVSDYCSMPFQARREAATQQTPKPIQQDINYEQLIASFLQGAQNNNTNKTQQDTNYEQILSSLIQGVQKNNGVKQGKNNLSDMFSQFF